MYQTATPRTLRPTGWLRRQLRLQAEGLCGHLDKIWPDVRDSAWIGGDREGWERVPYWLDGFIPLAYLLEDADMIARCRRYIDAILAAQNEDGWICPCRPEERGRYDTWAVQLISKVLTVYYSCSGDERIPEVLYRTLHNYYELLSRGDIHLFDWGQYRWFEALIAIDMLYGRYREPWLPALAALLREQGTDYRTLTDAWRRPLNRWQLQTHIVNLTMMLKAEALYCRITGEPYTDTAEALRDVLDTYNGTVYGSFTGDECLAGISPVHGTELCAIVEQMYSYETLYACTGESKWAERLELLAFNALPATVSDDMWTHQYVQMSNQIACERFPGKSYFRTNGPEAHLFGLEPNFGCCTANFGQGWPKLALSAILREGDTVLSALMLPCVYTDGGLRIELQTDYPFENRAHYRIATDHPFTLRIRIPSFARGLTLNGATMPTGELTVPIGTKGAELTVAFETEPHFISRPHGLQAVQCGSLLFSVPIAYQTRQHEYERNGVERRYPYCDYELLTAGEWRYGYTHAPLTLLRHGVGDIPFSSETPPLTVTAGVRRIDWELADGYESVCAPYPASAAARGEEQRLCLYPYGCTRLRMTELPFVSCQRKIRLQKQ